MFILFKIVLPFIIILSPFLLFIEKLPFRDFILRLVETRFFDDKNYDFRSALIVICIVLSIIIWFKISRLLKKHDFYDGKGNLYLSIPYVFFYIGAKVLRYGSTKLLLIPISMQFKLLVNETFKNFDIGFLPKEIDNDELRETDKKILILILMK